MIFSKRIVLLEQFRVGKSLLMRRFIENLFRPNYKSTLGIQKKVIILPNGDQLSLIVWDLQDFSSIAKARAFYLLGSEGFMCIFDTIRPITRISFEGYTN